VAGVNKEVVGMALDMQALTGDRAASSVLGLCYVPMVYAAEARKLGYGRVQLWTQTDNVRNVSMKGAASCAPDGRRPDPDLNEHCNRIPPAE
jgi:hypothetical protein